MASESERQEAAIRISEALQDPDVPKVYFNSFVNTLSSTDILILLQRNQHPVAVLNASYTTIKSLGERLKKLVEQLEEITGREIMDGVFIQESMQKSANVESTSSK